MENRREEMFLSVLGIGLAMVGGRQNSGTQMDPVRLASTLRRARSTSDDEEEENEEVEH